MAMLKLSLTGASFSEIITLGPNFQPKLIDKGWTLKKSKQNRFAPKGTL